MIRNLIGNGVFALLKNPEQLDILWRNPDLIDSAVRELLRYDSPVQLAARFSHADVEIAGRRMRAVQTVVCGIGAANRDPVAFTDPNVLDISRDEHSHVSFGRGVHHCLGVPLVGLQGRIALLSLLERFPSIRLAAEPEYRLRVVQRGLDELWIDVSG